VGTENCERARHPIYTAIFLGIIADEMAAFSSMPATRRGHGGASFRGLHNAAYATAAERGQSVKNRLLQNRKPVSRIQSANTHPMLFLFVPSFELMSNRQNQYDVVVRYPTVFRHVAISPT
jgi:hypothetical protein